MKNFDVCLKPLLEHEGGNDDDPQDPGGRTSRGVIQREYDAYRVRKGLPRRDVWTASDFEVTDIYRTEYWDALKCDALPTGVDNCVFDYGVNSGVGRAAKVLQREVGSAPDGVIGPITLRMTDDADPKQIINAICDERIGFLRQLSTYPRFGRGWETRVREVRAFSLKLASSAPIPVPAPKPRPSLPPVIATPAPETWVSRFTKWLTGHA